MAESDLAPEIDLDHLKTILKTVRQGDLIDVGKLVVLYSPDAPLHAEEVEGVDHEEPLMTRETRLRPNLCAVISQDCDIQRLPDIEPYIAVAPVTEVSEKIYGLASKGLTARHFAYPVLEGHEGELLALDARIVQSIEKTALASTHIARLETPLTEVQRDLLRKFLGDRFGRVAFPNDVVRQVIRPIERAVDFVARDANGGRVIASNEFIGLRWTPGRAYCSLLIVTNPSKRVKFKANEPEVRAALNLLKKKLNEYTREGDYTVGPVIRDGSEMRAGDLLEYTELRIEVDALPVPEDTAPDQA